MENLDKLEKAEKLQEKLTGKKTGNDTLCPKLTLRERLLGFLACTVLGKSLKIIAKDGHCHLHQRSCSFSGRTCS